MGLSNTIIFNYYGTLKQSVLFFRFSRQLFLELLIVLSIHIDDTCFEPMILHLLSCIVRCLQEQSSKMTMIKVTYFASLVSLSSLTKVRSEPNTPAIRYLL